MFTINLHNLIFHAFHGVHEEEKILGNTFEVNVSVTFEPVERVTRLHDTINYVSIYHLVKQAMEVPEPLLETLAQDMTQKIYEFDSRIKSISVSVKKKHPPISNMEGSVSVHYKKDF
jgi:dihydroneopterin aldolase